MGELYNYKKKQWEMVDEDKVEDSIRSASHGFQQGITMPMVSTVDGKIYDIKSDDAREALNKGYRLAKKEDIALKAEQRKRVIEKEHYGGKNTQAFTAGLLRGGTLGVSDAVMRLAGGDKVADSLNKLQEQNKGASIAGEIVGALHPGGLGTIATKATMKTAGKIVGKASQKAAQTAKAGAQALGASTKATQEAGRIASKLTSGAGQAAVEGSIHGMGAGVSESALGDPSETVSNILSSGGMGALFGAGFGVAGKSLQMSSPFLKDVASKTTGFVDRTAQKASRAIAKKAPAVWSKEVRDKYATMFGDVVDDVDARRVYEKLGPKEYEKYAGNVKALEKELLTQAKASVKTIHHELKKAGPKTERLVKEALLENKGDLGKLNNQMRVLKDRAYTQTDVFAKENLIGEAQNLNRYADEIDTMIKRLEGSGADGKAIAKDLHQEAKLLLGPQALAKTGKDRKAFIKAQGLSKYDEFTRLRKFHSALRNKSHKATGPEKAILNHYRQQVFEKSMNSYGQSSKLWNKAEDLYMAHKDVNKIFNGVKRKTLNKHMRGTVNEKKFVNMMLDQEKAETIRSAISVFDSTTPLMKKYHQAATTAKEKSQILSDLKHMIKTENINQKITHEVDADLIKEYVETFGKGVDKIDTTELKKLQQMLKTDLSASPMQATLMLKKLKGEDISRSLEQMADMEGGLRNLYQLSLLDKSTSEDVFQLAKQLLPAARIALPAVGGYFDPTLGAVLGGGVMLRSMRRPQSVLNGLSRVERWSSNGKKALDKRFSKLVDSLADPKLAKRLVKVTPSLTTQEDLQKRKEHFKSRAKALQEFSLDSETMRPIMEDINNTLESAPETATMMNAGLVNAAEFLKSKLPMDPFLSTGLPEEMSDWEPSDLELAQFERYVDAVQNPSLVLDKTIEGSVTPEEIETLQAVYPNIYSRLQETAMSAIVEHGKNIPYERKVMLGVLLDIPTDYSLTPGFINAMQSGYQAEGQDPGGRPQGTGKAPDLAPKEDLLTEYDKITYGVN